MDSTVISRRSPFLSPLIQGFISFRDVFLVAALLTYVPKGSRSFITVRLVIDIVGGRSGFFISSFCPSTNFTDGYGLVPTLTKNEKPISLFVVRDGFRVSFHATDFDGLSISDYFQDFVAVSDKAFFGVRVALYGLLKLCKGLYGEAASCSEADSRDGIYETLQHRLFLGKG